MDQWLPTVSNSGNRGLELQDVATEDNTITIVIAYATVYPFVEARGTMNAAVASHAITNVVVNDTAAFFSSPALVHGSVETGLTRKRRNLFNTLLDQIFTYVQYAKVLLALNASFVGVLLSVHGQSNIFEVHLAIVTIFLGSGFIALLISVLLQDSYPEYAEPVALVGAICVLANMIIFFAVICPRKVDPVVFISVASFITFLCISSGKIYKWHKGHND